MLTTRANSKHPAKKQPPPSDARAVRYGVTREILISRRYTHTHSLCERCGVCVFVRGLDAKARLNASHCLPLRNPSAKSRVRGRALYAVMFRTQHTHFRSLSLCVSLSITVLSETNDSDIKHSNGVLACVLSELCVFSARTRTRTFSVSEECVTERVFEWRGGGGGGFWGGGGNTVRRDGTRAMVTSNLSLVHARSRLTHKRYAILVAYF